MSSFNPDYCDGVVRAQVLAQLSGIPIELRPGHLTPTHAEAVRAAGAVHGFAALHSGDDTFSSELNK